MLRRLFASFLALVASASLALADATIDQLTNGAALTGAELVPMFQTANPAVRTTTGAIANLGSSSGLTTTKNINFGAGSAGGPPNTIIYGNNLGATGTCTSGCNLNWLSFNDNVAAGSPLTHWAINTNIGGAGTTGSRIVEHITLNINAALPGAGNNFQVSEFTAQASVTAGGVGGGGSNGAGSLFGGNPNVRLISGATNWHQLVGEEVDIGIQTGASADNMIGFQVVQGFQQSGTTGNADLAFSVNKVSGPGWDILYADGSWDGNPALKTSGTFLGCYPHIGSGNCGTIANGIDLSKYGSITGSAFKSPGFVVDGNGNTTHTSQANPSVSTLTLTGATALTTSQPVLNMTQTWVTGGTAYTAIKLNVINTASAAGSLLLDLQTGGSSVFHVDRFGNSTFANPNASLLLVAISALAGQRDILSFQEAGVEKWGFYKETTNSLFLWDTAASVVPLQFTTASPIKFGSPAQWTANGSVATAMTSVGPTGSHTTVQEWFTVIDSAGTTRYIPAY
jgi:hypothetical protein